MKPKGRSSAVTITLLALGALALLVYTTPASAVQKPDDEAVLPDFDLRRGPTRATAPRRVSDAQLSEFTRKKYMWSINEQTGALRSLMAGQDRLSWQETEDPLAAARAYVASHEGLLGLTPSGADRLVVESDYSTRHNGIQHVWFIQKYEGLTVFNARIGVHMDELGRVFAVSSDEVATSFPRDLTPTVGAAEAVAIASIAIDEPYEGTDPVEETSAADRTGVFEQAHLGSSPTAELLLFNMGTEARLAWMIMIEPAGQGAHYLVMVDATSGDVLMRRNVLLYAAGAGTVFLTDPDMDNGQRVVVEFGSTPESPAGWLGAANVTTGNNVHAYHDPGLFLLLLCLNGTPQDVDPPTPFQQFHYPLDLSQDPRNYTDAAITNLFYLNNFIHDYLYALGFDEQSGNYQVDNFGLGGLGGDPINAEGQDGWPACESVFLPNTNNANFMPSPDGQPGRMQMYVWTFTDPYRDGDLDKDIVIHEYCHGLSTRLVGGPANSSSLNNHQGGSMGEGWSDYFAASIIGDDAVGEYSYGQPDGIRTYRYGESPYTFGDLGNVGGGCQVHDDGEIWAATLWQLRSDYMAGYGPSGRTMVEQDVVDSMKIMPSSPSFLDARDATVQAAINNGEDPCLVWQTFAARGMGIDASVAGNGCDTVTEDFNVPAGCECVTPLKPGDTQGVNTAGLTVELSWTGQAASGAVAYQVFRADGGCSGTLEPVGSVQEPSTTYIDTVSGAGLYGYAVSSVPITGTSCASQGACFEVNVDCVAGAPDVLADSLVAEKTGPDTRFLWSSSGTGAWNVHTTRTRQDLTEIYADPSTIIATVATTEHLQSAIPPPDTVDYYVVFGADGCTGGSMP